MADREICFARTIGKRTRSTRGQASGLMNPAPRTVAADDEHHRGRACSLRPLSCRLRSKAALVPATDSACPTSPKAAMGAGDNAPDRLFAVERRACALPPGRTCQCNGRAEVTRRPAAWEFGRGRYQLRPGVRRRQTVRHSTTSNLLE
jgi:hypothetical protein